MIIHKIVLTLFILGFGKIFQIPVPTETEVNIGKGSQPEISIDSNGNIRMVYGIKSGKERDLYLATSTDGGKSFSEPLMLGKFSNMGLGMGRGPQIASSSDYTIVTVGDHFGGLYSLRLNIKSNEWSKPVKVNDTDSTALEALSAILTYGENSVFTVWLDLRLGKVNNLYGSFSKDGGLTWSKNQLVYQGKQDGICDCCKPSLAMDKNGRIYVMFRNKMNGARNMYVIYSDDGGKHFSEAKKQGLGDYMINGCPMDGGDLSVDTKRKVTTIWRRDKDVYFSTPEKAETKLGGGRTPVLVQTITGTAMAWEQDGEIQFRDPDGSKTHSLGRGQYPKMAQIPGPKPATICAFERDGSVIVKTIEY